MLNLLYSAIVYGHPLTDDWYAKKHASVNLTSKRAQDLQRLMLEGIPETHIGLAACVITDWAKYTPFADEIAKLDPENTYGPVKHHNLTLRAYLKPVAALKPLYVYLDKDIADQLVCPSWFDIMAACGLQLLREAANG